MKTSNDTILSLMQGIHRSLHHQFRELQGDFCDLTFLQLQALLFITSCKQVSMHEIAEELAITPAATTLLIDRLVMGGWLHRKALPADRRMVLVVPSYKAKKELTHIQSKKNQAMEIILNQLSSGERQRLLTLLQKMHSIMHAKDLEVAP